MKFAAYNRLSDEPLALFGVSLWCQVLGHVSKPVSPQHRQDVVEACCPASDLAGFFDRGSNIAGRPCVVGGQGWIAVYTRTEVRMLIQVTKPLFAWDCLEDSPSLSTIRELLAALPDGPLLASLRDARGKGRDDYPVSVVWGVHLLKIILRHPTTEACLAELQRNEGLRRLIGIFSEEQVPKAWNMPRFEEVLGQEPHCTFLKEIFQRQIQTLGDVMPDLGKDLAGDATALSARAGNKNIAQQEIAAGLPQPSGGRTEYLDDEGTVTKIVEWFGYKLHLLVDVKHEVALAYEITDTKAGDGETLPIVLPQAQAHRPPDRIRTLAYDKAGDPNPVHELLSRHHIRPGIQTRSSWTEDPGRMLPGHDGNSNIVYDEAGTVYCYDRVSQPLVRHQMAYIGYEPKRETIKYRQVPLSRQARRLDLPHVGDL